MDSSMLFLIVLFILILVGNPVRMLYLKLQSVSRSASIHKKRTSSRRISA